MSVSERVSECVSECVYNSYLVIVSRRVVGSDG